jgi:hypothetical protein
MRGEKLGEDTEEESLECLASLKSSTPGNITSLKKIVRVMNSNLHSQN